MKENPSARKAPKPVGIWLCVSKDYPAKGESPEHHEKRARSYAEAKGWNVKEVYRLPAVSGTSVLKHSEAKRMLADVKSGRISILIFSKLASLARNMRELSEISDLFREQGADLISLQEPIDTSSPAGHLFYPLVAAMAAWESEATPDRVPAIVPIRSKLEKPLGGQAPLGYQWKDKQLIVNPAEAPVRKLIYELFLEHRRKKTVARLLNEGGYRTRNGSLFSDTTVRRLLRDPTAKGLRRANYTKSRGDKKPWELKPKEEWVFSEVDPIVTEALWNQCNAILDEQEKSHKRPARKPVHLFSGLAYCDCGHKMYVPSNTPKYVCDHCRNKISIEDLEGIFQEQLKHFSFSPYEIADYLGKSDTVIREKEAWLEQLNTEHRKLERELDNLYELYLSDQITKQGFDKKYLPLEEKRKQLEAAIPVLQGELDFLKIQNLPSDPTVTEAKDLYREWPKLPIEVKRRVLENLIDSLVIGKEDVAIHLCDLPSAQDSMTSNQRNSRSK